MSASFASTHRPRLISSGESGTPVAADVLVLTVTHAEERTAVRTAFGVDEASSPPWVLEFPRKQGWRPILLVVDVIGRQGGPPAAAFTLDRLKRFSPSAAILVGTCGGREGRVQLDDVVVSNLVVNYQHEVREPGKVRKRPDYFVPPFGLLSQVQEFATSGTADWRSVYTDVLESHAEFGRVGRKSIRLPQPHLAVIAGGDVSLQDGTLDVLSEHFHDRLYAVEMESQGFAQACYMNGVPWLVVRGVSDFASEAATRRAAPQERQNRQHHLRSSLSASAFVRGFLTEVDLTPESLWGGGGPPLALTYDFHKALDSTEQHQLRARKRVQIVSANATYDDHFSRYVRAILSRRVRVSRILDTSRWTPGNAARHIQETWNFLTKDEGEGPAYTLSFAPSDGLGVVLLDEASGPSASFFLYLGGGGCLYVRSNRSEAIEAARSRLEILEGKASQFRASEFSGRPSVRTLEKAIEGHFVPARPVSAPPRSGP